MTKSNPDPHPTLSEMGVASPKQIARYYVSSLNFVDVLRITYDRPKGSILSSSRTYKFPREHETVPAAGDGTASVAMKTHPKLRAAIEELDEILKAKAHKESIAREILDEIELLEEDIAMRTECLRALVGRIPTGE